MSESMIDRVALAIAKAERMEENEDRVLNVYAPLARAAIEAMRDPSFDMMQAMYEAMFADKWDCTQAAMVGAGFEAAIDAALASPEMEASNAPTS